MGCEVVQDRSSKGASNTHFFNVVGGFDVDWHRGRPLLLGVRYGIKLLNVNQWIYLNRTDFHLEQGASIEVVQVRQIVN